MGILRPFVGLAPVLSWPDMAERGDGGGDDDTLGNQQLSSKCATYKEHSTNTLGPPDCALNANEVRFDSDKWVATTR